VERHTQLHIHVPVTEKTGLAIIKLLTAALTESKISQAQLDEVTAQINQSTDNLSAAIPALNATGEASA